MPYGLQSGAVSALAYEAPREVQPFVEGLLALERARQHLDAVFGEFLSSQAEAFKQSENSLAGAPAVASSQTGSSAVAAPGGNQPGKMAVKGENEAPADLSHPGAASATDVAAHRENHSEEESDFEEDQQTDGTEHIGEATSGPALVPLPGPVIAIEMQSDEPAPGTDFAEMHACPAPGSCAMDPTFAAVGSSGQSSRIFAGGEITSMPGGANEVENAPSQVHVHGGEQTGLSLNVAPSTSSAGALSDPAFAGSIWPALDELRERLSQARQAVEEAVTGQLELADEQLAEAHEELSEALKRAQETLGKLRNKLEAMGQTLPQIGGPAGSAAESARVIPWGDSASVQGGAAANRGWRVTGADAVAPAVTEAGKTMLAAAAVLPAGTVVPPIIPAQGSAPAAEPITDLGVEPPAKTELPPVIVEWPPEMLPGGVLPLSPRTIAMGEGEEATWPVSPRVDRARLVDFVAAAMHAAHARGGDIRLQLQPPELGAVHIRLQVEEGKLQAHLQVETEQARALLLEHVAALHQRLAELSIKIERFQVDLMDQQFAGSRQHTARERHQPWQQDLGWGPAPRPPRPGKSAAVIARSHLRGGVVDLQA